ncbi:hypothetical protein BC792_101265 [Sphingobacterium allocomposti]|uniref:Uncharacterized protein n=1 Tax=Sphingobacterium allocomposti TaxID=415956 RepID=A0A5S5DRU5_9SPHI|nr:hypothetical protein BC792_101265 [Sphingobacterium composti Yoo et al. 2007 non Ten et al. 2007]
MDSGITYTNQLTFGLVSLQRIICIGRVHDGHEERLRSLN